MLPEEVRCKVQVQATSVLHTLTVELTNRLEVTAGAVLEVPRIEGLILLEEWHRCGAVVYEPIVMPKEVRVAALR